MKKKAILVSLMLISCISLIFGVKSLQSYFAAETKVSGQDSSIKALADTKNFNNSSDVNQTDKTQDTPGKTDEKRDKDSVSTSDKVISNTKRANNDNVDIRNSTNKTSTQSSNSTSGTTTDGTQSKTSGENAVQKPNFIIKNDVTGDIIFSVYMDMTEDTVGNITINILNKKKLSYRASGSGDSLYFSSINGIKERSSGSASGWCFYVNGNKVTVGAGKYKIHKGDIIEWKFVKNGIY